MTDTWPERGSLNYTETYTATGAGYVQDRTGDPLQKFSLQVNGTGATPTLWTVQLEGSNDNVNWSKILQHDNLNLGIGVSLSTGANYFPSTFVRINVKTLTLGGATNVTVNVVGME